jgi:hypothetical protein
VRTGTVPAFTAVRSTGEEPHFVPAASPRLRRGPSPWPPGGRVHTRPGVVPTQPNGHSVGCAPLPAQIRQIEAGRYLRDVITRVPLVLLPVTLAEPAPSGSSGPSRLCQGCSHPHLAPSGAGCPQLHRPATTGSAVVVSHLHSNNSASWRTDASIKLSSVVSSLNTVSARAMLAAMINGETDRLRFADMAKGKMRRKIPDLAQALTGTFDVDHAQLVKSMLGRLELVELAFGGAGCGDRRGLPAWQHQIELLQTVPGVGETVAQVIVAETGADMSRFTTAAHLAAWAGLAPAMHESAGRQTPAGKRHGNKWLTAMPVEATGSVGRMHGKNYLAAQHARLTRRRGMRRALVAVAHSILVAAYWMLTRDEPYHDLGADWHQRRNNEAHTRRLIAQLEHLGHTVIIDPAPKQSRLALSAGGTPDAAAVCPPPRDSRVCVTHWRGAWCSGYVDAVRRGVCQSRAQVRVGVTGVWCRVSPLQPWSLGTRRRRSRHPRVRCRSSCSRRTAPQDRRRR